ncbi:MAG TPA: oxidoreductase [Pseudonocardiaceae bacterium]|jgi:protochlorophyllide reductase|nr:oxidoreductase [Pseudonocardiaceae bacterium]
MANWTEQDIPDQSGRTILVTGANSGLGLRSARVLAAAGARVLLGCRSAERGAAAVAMITEAGGDAELVLLDLADLNAVRTAAEQVRERTGDQLDVLINNAGVMMVPNRRTAEGFESQFGTNHLGHAALTWLLMPALRGRPGARVVALGSLVAKFGRINLADPNFEHRRYSAGAGYAQSKLADVLFALELDRHLRAAGLDVLSVAAHPGYSDTSLTGNMATAYGPGSRARTIDFVTGLGARLIAQRPELGALPQLYAATAPDVQGGRYYGPNGIAEMHGYPHQVTPSRRARDAGTASRLWTLTAELTKVSPDPA